MDLFASLIIYTFQLICLVETVFFSLNKSVRIVFQFVFSVKRTGPLLSRLASVHIQKVEATVGLGLFGGAL